MKSFTMLVVLLLATPAWAGDWVDCLNETTQKTVSTGNEVCWDPVTSDLDSAVLYVGHCENMDIIYNADTTGTATNTTCAIRQCLGNTATTPDSVITADASACTIIGGSALTGVAPLDALEGPGRTWIYANCTTDPGTDTPRVLVHCNGP